MLVAHLPVFSIIFSVLGHPCDLEATVYVPYNTVGWDDTVSSIYACRSKSKNCEMGDLWMNVLVLVREFFLSSLIFVFFQTAYFVMSEILNTPFDYPHTFGIPALDTSLCCVQTKVSALHFLFFFLCSLVLFFVAFSNLIESSFPSSLLFFLFPDLSTLIMSLWDMACSFLDFSLRPSEVFTCWRASKTLHFFY